MHYFKQKIIELVDTVCKFIQIISFLQSQIRCLHRQKIFPGDSKNSTSRRAITADSMWAWFPTFLTYLPYLSYLPPTFPTFQICLKHWTQNDNLIWKYNSYKVQELENSLCGPATQVAHREIGDPQYGRLQVVFSARFSWVEGEGSCVSRALGTLGTLFSVKQDFWCT